MHITERRLVVVPSNILFAGVYVCTFQPENLTGRGIEGVKLFFLRSFSHWYVKGFPSKRRRLKTDVLKDQGNILFCRRVRASLTSKNVQVGAVKGLREV